MLTIEKFVEELCCISDRDFTCENIWRFLDENSVGADSLEKYLHWSSKCYTRNLIFKNDLFELMAICWDVGQQSRVHNHSEQKCWMSMPIGTLQIKNFKTLELDEDRKRCLLEETDSFNIHSKLPASVNLEEPIHQVLNLAEFNQRAVSLHIYSKPFDKCLAYCLETNQFSLVPLFYTSIDGKLCDNVEL